MLYGMHPQPSTPDYATGSSRDSVSEAQIHDLQERLDQLILVNLAMWSLIQEETRLTEQDLMERVQNIDLMDGEKDGKVTQRVAKCSSCNRPMHPRHKKCIYCGSERLILSAFDRLT